MTDDGSTVMEIRSMPMRPMTRRLCAFAAGALLLTIADGPALGAGEPTSQAVLARLRSAQPAERVAAAEALTEIAGADFERTLPSLRDALRDPVAEVRLRVAQALQAAAVVSVENARALEGVTPQLLERLTDTAAEVRAAAALALAATYPNTPQRAAGDLTRLLTDSDPEVRTAALAAISGLRSSDPAVTPALLTTLQTDSVGTVRGEAARALGTLGVAEQPVVEALTAALADGELYVRRQAVRSLGRLGPAAFGAADSLERIARDPREDAELRMHATYALRSIGSPAADDLPDPTSFRATH